MEEGEYCCSSILFGFVLCGIGLIISVPRKMHVLTIVSALAPILVPFFIFIVRLLQSSCTRLLLCVVRDNTDRHINTTNHPSTTTAAPVEISILQPMLPEPPITRRPWYPTRIKPLNIPMYLYEKEAVDDGPECSICKELFKKEDVVALLPCIHSFHNECIETWFRTKREVSEQTCPVCRTGLDMEIPRDIALIID